MIISILEKYNKTMNLTHKEWLVLLNYYNGLVPDNQRKPNSAISCGACKSKIIKKLNIHYNV